MSVIAAVLFDMDGVLADSEPLHLRATRLALGDRGASFGERDNRTFGGTPEAQAFRVLRILFDLDVSSDELLALKRGHLVSLIRAEGRPLPGVPDIPIRLRTAGLRLGLVSASGRAVMHALLDAIGLGGAFDAILSGDEIARSKPAPDAWLMAARRLGVVPEHCLAIGGSRDGVLAAKAAGMSVAAVPAPIAGDEDFSPADFVLPSLEALPKALEVAA
jgi:HAD superfamily hydrolase (TIGR01509 family)